MQKSLHHHIDPVLVRAQLDYTESLPGKETARAIIACKLRNCAFLFSDYQQSRKRAGSDQEAYITRARQRITRIISELPSADNRASRMLMEARASRIYWSAVRVICRRGPEWRRVYPHARDPLNVLLNTGYTVLARSILARMEEKRLVPEIGIVHGDSSGDALVYDVMECFRQPAVDAAVIPLFSRKRTSPAVFDERGMKRGFWRLRLQQQKRFMYHGRCERLERIIAMEILRLRESIISGLSWTPYQHPWGHHVRCKTESDVKQKSGSRMAEPDIAFISSLKDH